MKTNIFIFLILLAVLTAGFTFSRQSSLVMRSDPTSPDQVVKAFYNWYLEYIGDRSTGGFRNPLIDGAYRESKYLTGDFIREIDEGLALMQNGGHDPFLCAQDIPGEISIVDAWVENLKLYISMDSNFEGHQFTVVLKDAGDGYRIDKINCQ